jgi:hypothetical protein
MGIVPPSGRQSDCNQANSESNIINKVGIFVERVTGIEPALSAWEADVLPLNYTRVHVQWLFGPAEEPGCAVFAQTSYRNR